MSGEVDSSFKYSMLHLRVNFYGNFYSYSKTVRLFFGHSV